MPTKALPYKLPTPAPLQVYPAAPPPRDTTEEWPMITTPVVSGQWKRKPFNQAEFEAWVYSFVRSGAMSSRSAEHLLDHCAIAVQRNVADGNIVAVDNSQSAPSVIDDLYLDRVLAKAGLPERFWSVRIESTPFLTERNRPLVLADFSRPAFMACRRLAGRWEPGAVGLTLASPESGSGKTLLTCAVGVYVARAKRGRDGRFARVRFTKAEAVLEAFRASYGATWAKDGASVRSTAQVRMDYVESPDLLIVDDLGKEAMKGGEAGEWARARFFELLDFRAEHGLTTLFTTNLGGYDDLATRYGSATASRLAGRSPIVSLEGSPDFRQSEPINLDDDEDPFAD